MSQSNLVVLKPRNVTVKAIQQARTVVVMPKPVQQMKRAA